MVRLKLATCMILSTWLWHARAAGGDSQFDTAMLPDRIRILYEAPDDCPARAAMMQRVTQRVKIPWIADDTELARHIRVTIAPADSGFVARMEYVDSTLRQVVRVVNANDCDQAVSAIALVTALAIESQAVHPGSPNPEAKAAASSVESAAQSTPRDDSRAAAARAKRRAHPTASPQPPAKPEEPPAWVQEAGIRLGAASGFSPGLAMGAAAFWGVGRRPLPMFRLTLSWYDNQVSTGDSNAPGAHFGLFAALPQFCWSQRPLDSVQFALGGCAGVETGLYKVSGVSPKSTDEAASPTIRLRSHSLLWASVLFSFPVRLDYHDMFFELAPELRVPLVTGEFQYQGPYRPVYEIPHVALGLGFATGLTFP
jgi:hypothetical protein